VAVEARNGENERNRFAERNQRFRERGARHWNHWDAKSKDFARSFVFNGLAAVLFRASRMGSPASASGFRFGRRWTAERLIST